MYGVILIDRNLQFFNFFSWALRVNVDFNNNSNNNKLTKKAYLSDVTVTNVSHSDAPMSRLGASAERLASK